MKLEDFVAQVQQELKERFPDGSAVILKKGVDDRGPFVTIERQRDFGEEDAGWSALVPRRPTDSEEKIRLLYGHLKG